MKSIAITACLCVLAIGLARFASSQALADAPVDRSKVSANQEKIALEFARQHHPQLADLLRGLKSSKHPGYQQAVRDLYRTSDRIERLKDRPSNRYELELRQWKIDSRIRLLAAQQGMDGQLAYEEELKVLIQDKLDIKRSLLQMERDRLAARLSKLDEQLDETEGATEDVVEKELDRLLKDATRRAAAAKRNLAKRPQTVENTSAPKSTPRDATKRPTKTSAAQKKPKPAPKQ